VACVDVVVDDGTVDRTDVDDATRVVAVDAW